MHGSRLRLGVKGVIRPGWVKVKNPKYWRHDAERHDQSLRLPPKQLAARPGGTSSPRHFTCELRIRCDECPGPLMFT
jgi:hypothetical protein